MVIYMYVAPGLGHMSKNMSLCLKFCAVGALCNVFIFLVKLTEWPPIGK